MRTFATVTSSASRMRVDMRTTYIGSIHYTICQADLTYSCGGGVNIILLTYVLEVTRRADSTTTEVRHGS